MKKYFLISALAVFSFACNTNKQKSETGAESKNVQAYSSAVNSLNKGDMNSLSMAVGLFDKHLKNEEEGTQALPYLLRYINQSLDTLNNVLEANGDQYASLVQDSIDKPSPQQLEFIKNMVNNHTQLQSDGEGGAYLEYDYNWLAKKIGGKISEPAKQYLQITAAEASQPLTKDAAIMLPPQTLVDRVIQIENLQKQQLPVALSEDLKKVHQLYINALLFGADNTPSIEHGSLKITPAFAQAYNYALTKYPQSAVAAKIKEWQAVAAAGDGKKIDEYIKRNWQ